MCFPGFGGNVSANKKKSRDSLDSFPVDESLRVRRLDRFFLDLYKKKGAKSSSRTYANKLKRALEANEGKWECRLCGMNFVDPAEISIDHIVPMFFKPLHAPHELQLAHKTCNSARSCMPIDYFFMLRAVRKRFPDHTIDNYVKARKLRELQQRNAQAQCNVQPNVGTVGS
jgi:hypothetical protein